MKKKPSGPRYRNLFARGGVIYYRRKIGGRRLKVSTATSDWSEAAAFRDLYEQRKGIGRLPLAILDTPTFAAFATRYLAEDTSHLAGTTRADREGYLRPDGPLIRFFGGRKLDEITAPIVREWWNQEVLGRSRSISTGRSYLSALAGVVGYATDLGLLEANPLPAFREQLRRRGRTKGARARSDSGSTIRPIESLGDLLSFTRAAFAEAEIDLAQTRSVQRHRETRHARSLEERTGGLRAVVAILCMLDAGLRVGEVAGMTWGQVRWGSDESDPNRAIVIDRSRPRGGEVAPPKSGRRRVVALSRRLRAALELLYRIQFRPAPEAAVLPGFEPHNFSTRAWRRITERAGIGHRAPKDLRDTFASWVLSLGVQLGYVSQQLGHADVAVTARHYARWCGGDVYRDPMPLEAGEVPADLIARASEWSQSGPTPEFSWRDEIEKLSNLAGLVVAQARVELATPAFSVRCSTN